MVPYDGSNLEPFVIEERGCEPFRVPRACLVCTENIGAMEKKPAL
jgi:hypothetical protein